jgi:hypothetical protein
MRRLTIAALVAASCATAPPAAKTPDWPQVPPIIAEAICVKLRAEGIGSETPLMLVNQTQPIITANAIASLGRLFFKRGQGLGDPVRLAANAISGQQMIPVSATGTCAWQVVSTTESNRYQDTMVVQVSVPFVNPYAKGESGLFARLLVAGGNAQWYWVPTAWQGNQWRIGRVMSLDVSGE